MAVQRRRKVPKAIYLVVTDMGKQSELASLYHSYGHAWNLKEKSGGRMFKIPTADMTEILT